MGGIKGNVGLNHVGWKYPVCVCPLMCLTLVVPVSLVMNHVCATLSLVVGWRMEGVCINSCLLCLLLLPHLPLSLVKRILLDLSVWACPT